MSRLLLPCTSGIQEEAIDAALMLAQWCGATLVPLLLNCLPETAETEHALLERRREICMFQDIVGRRASLMNVPVEGIIRSTHNVRRSIHLFAQEMKCVGILLFTREGMGVLLDTNEVKQVVEQEKSTPLYHIHLIHKENRASLRKRLIQQFQRQKQDKVFTRQDKLPRWYKVTLLGCSLIVMLPIIINSVVLLNAPMLNLIALIIRFVFLIALSVFAFSIPRVFLTSWRGEQAVLEGKKRRRFEEELGHNNSEYSFRDISEEEGTR